MCVGGTIAVPPSPGSYQPPDVGASAFSEAARRSLPSLSFLLPSPRPWSSDWCEARLWVQIPCWVGLMRPPPVSLHLPAVSTRFSPSRKPPGGGRWCGPVIIQLLWLRASLRQTGGSSWGAGPRCLLESRFSGDTTRVLASV